MRDSAKMRRTDLARVFLQRASQWRCSSARFPSRAPAREFILINQ